MYKLLTISSLGLLASANTLRPNSSLAKDLTITQVDTYNDCASSKYMHKDYITHPESNYKQVCDMLVEGVVYGLEGGDLMKRKNDGTCHFFKDYSIIPDKCLCDDSWG